MDLSQTGLLVVAFGIFGLLPGAAPATPVPHNEPTVDALKARIASASVAQKPHLCVQIAQMRLDEADKLYASGDPEKAQSALTEVVAYSELARDYSIQSHKYQKQSEIAVRHMTRRLTDILHSLAQQDQDAVRQAVERLNRVRDDLLASMFLKGAK